MSQQGCGASSLTAEQLCILTSPSCLDKINGLFWPTSGPSLLDLANVPDLQQHLYRYVGYSRTATYTWHPLAALAQLHCEPTSRPKANLLLASLMAELDASEAAAAQAFVLAMPGLSATVSNTVPPELYELWQNVCGDLFTFVLAGFADHSKMHTGHLDIPDYVEDYLPTFMLELVD